MADEILQSLTLDDVEDLTYDFTKAKVLKVYDGDTITIGAYYDGGYKKFQVRLYGVDCAEIRGGTQESKDEAKKAKEYVSNLVLNKVVTIDVMNNKIYDGKIVREKFGRLLARITTPNGEDLSDLLVSQGLAKKYFGGKKE
jgi:hypothetical protein